MPRERYFKNPYPDYSPGSNIEVPKLQWHSTIDGIVKQIVDAVPNATSPDGGLYVGSSGIAYMLYYLSMYEPLAAANRSFFLDNAMMIFQRDIKYTEKNQTASDAVSFILGSAGIFALGSFLGKARNDEGFLRKYVEKYQSLAVHCLKPRFLSCGSDELFVGRAGYLCGMLAMEKRLGIKILDDETINKICHTIVQSGEEYAKRQKSDSPLMYAYYNTEYIGAAHGISSILQFVLSCPSYLQSNPHGADLVKTTVNWLLRLQQKNGNFVPALDELHSPRPESEELVHWCHGAPGVVYLFAKAYTVWGNPEYLEACLKCGELTWNKGLLTKGPGICHGVAGNGYVFLLLYRLTGDKKHLYRAHKFAEFMFTEQFKARSRTPDNPYSLYEGWAGTVCFLVDLLQPDKAEFPFFPIL